MGRKSLICLRLDSEPRPRRPRPEAARPNSSAQQNAPNESSQTLAGLYEMMRCSALAAPRTKRAGGGGGRVLTGRVHNLQNQKKKERKGGNTSKRRKEEQASRQLGRYMKASRDQKPIMTSLAGLDRFNFYLILKIIRICGPLCREEMTISIKNALSAKK